MLNINPLPIYNITTTNDIFKSYKVADYYPIHIMNMKSVMKRGILMLDNENMPMQEGMEMSAPEMMMGHMNNERILNALQKCEETCEHMVTHILRHTDMQGRSKQVELLRDCADMCTFTGKYIARHSDFSKYTANLCAYVCSVCGNECLRFRDEMSQRCGRICHDCVRECKEFANM